MLVRVRNSVLFGVLFFSSASVALAAPVISPVSPTTATSNVPVTLSATVNSSVSIQSCNLYVDLEDVGAMTVSGEVASRSFTFASGGSRIAFVFCRDTSNGIASGPNTALWVEGAIITSPPLSSPSPAPTPTPTAPNPPAALAFGTLIKLACPEGAEADHPCKAVYYYGRDGKRHAFPNSRVYFTWYANFDAVITVSASEMSALTLGSNVVYRPGVRMVKFTTVSRVYGVGRDGVLHWIKSEEAASVLYGADWNTKIDDISDVFYTNYRFGTEIDDPTDFSPVTETSSVPSIDENR